MTLPDLLSHSSSVWAGLIAVVGVLYTAIKTLTEFNDEYLQKRPFKRLAFLREQIRDEPDLTNFLAAAVHEEVFRATYGMPVTPRVAKAIERVYASGRFSLSELKACALYTTVDEDGRLSIKPGKGGYFILIASLFFIATMGFYVSVLLFGLISVGTVVSIASSLGILIFYFFFAWYFGRDGRAVLLARRAHKKLGALASEA